tara:strand:+ start:185 stop:403 length:219 start_codon:yes stop_codon:yes gene_type:complete
VTSDQLTAINSSTIKHCWQQIPLFPAAQPGVLSPLQNSLHQPSSSKLAEKLESNDHSLHILHRDIQIEIELI